MLNRVAHFHLIVLDACLAGGCVSSRSGEDTKRFRLCRKNSRGTGNNNLTNITRGGKWVMNKHDAFIFA